MKVLFLVISIQTGQRIEMLQRQKAVFMSLKAICIRLIILSLLKQVLLEAFVDQEFRAKNKQFEIF